MAFCRYVVTYPDLLDEISGGDHSAGEFVADCQRRMDPLAAPFVPFPDVQVRAANAGCFDLDKYIMGAGFGDGYVFDNEARPPVCEWPSFCLT